MSGHEKVTLILDPIAKMLSCLWIEILKVYKSQRMEGIDLIKINESKDTPCDMPLKRWTQKHHISVIAAPPGKYIVKKWILMGGVCRCDNPIKQVKGFIRCVSGTPPAERFLLASFVCSQRLKLEPRSLEHDAQHSNTNPSAVEPAKCLSDGWV